MRGQCDACGYRDTPVEEFGMFDASLGRRPRFCEVCATTFVSKAHSDPGSLTVAMLFRTIAIIGNLILDAIHKAQYGEKR